jgi:hypothetical protein
MKMSSLDIPSGSFKKVALEGKKQILFLARQSGPILYTVKLIVSHFWPFPFSQIHWVVLRLLTVGLHGFASYTERNY